MPIQLKGRSSARRGKTQLKDLLVAPDPEALRSWAASDPKAVRSLFSGLFELDPLMRWRNIWALGQTAAVYRQQDNDDAIRDWIRRLLWAMNDESGATFYHAPEAIGEILYNVEYLIPEFIAVLFSHRAVSPFEPGVYWAGARVAPQSPRSLRVLAPVLREALTDPQPAVRAHAAEALIRIRDPVAREAIADLTNDNESVTFYDFEAHELRLESVGSLATRALADAAG